MKGRNFNIYWGIRNLKQIKECNITDPKILLSYYLQGCLDAGIKQEGLDKIVEKVNEDIEQE